MQQRCERDLKNANRTIAALRAEAEKNKENGTTAPAESAAAAAGDAQRRVSDARLGQRPAARA